MKTKTFLMICLLLGFSVSQISGQTLKKDAVVAVSSYTLVLNPDVTMSQFLDFYINKYIPEFEKNFPGIKDYLLSGDRGEKKNQFGEIWLFESVSVRDKYFPTEESEGSDIFIAAMEKMTAINTELGKYVVSWERIFTDWIIK